MSVAALDGILPENDTLAAMIAPYLNLSGSTAKCGMSVFPLILTSNESTLFFDNYMANFTNQISTNYGIQMCPSCLDWSNININIKTAVL